APGDPWRPSRRPEGRVQCRVCRLPGAGRLPLVPHGGEHGFGVSRAYVTEPPPPQVRADPRPDVPAVAVQCAGCAPLVLELLEPAVEPAVEGDLLVVDADADLGLQPLELGQEFPFRLGGDDASLASAAWPGPGFDDADPPAVTGPLVDAALAVVSSGHRWPPLAVVMVAITVA